MSGLLSTLNTAKSGMNVSQVAIQTTSHNISNINTPGYSRQRVNQSASSPIVCQEKIVALVQGK